MRHQPTAPGTEIILVTATAGLKPALLAEARALGARSVRDAASGVELSGEPGLHRRANLWLRTASRVLLRIGEVRLQQPKELRAALSRLDLRPWISRGEPAEIEVASRTAGLEDRATFLRHAWELQSGEGTRLTIRAEGELCAVYVDTSGELLHRRGYRQEISRAPLRESLAAGMLLLAGWDPSLPLWDPMCGSGTIAIEAASISLGRAPGIGRAFAFERFPSHDSRAWAQERATAVRGERQALQAPIMGSDLHSGSLGTARRNARRAGVEERLQLFRHDVTRPWRAMPPSGWLVSNLPYGKRVGDAKQLGELHRAFGATLRGMPKWKAALLVAGGKEIEHQLSWRPARVLPLENGGIKCRLLVGELAGV